MLVHSLPFPLLSPSRLPHFIDPGIFRTVLNIFSHYTFPTTSSIYAASITVFFSFRSLSLQLTPPLSRLKTVLWVLHLLARIFTLATNVPEVLPAHCLFPQPTTPLSTLKGGVLGPQSPFTYIPPDQNRLLQALATPRHAHKVFPQPLSRLSASHGGEGGNHASSVTAQ